MKQKKTGGKEQALPKSLWRFYVRYAAKPMMWFLIAWMFLFISWDIANSTWWPMSQQKIVALFENGVTGDGFRKRNADTKIITKSNGR